ncbi:metallophosphoesterase [Nitriliruptor alkaliphilus]|uniref:metallophosphoesterase n=1 Tax=Nitriliruptor alkaliphilus TaxID=427918 RepID=UPI0012ED1548|nr:metallophosphoesterase [Nitriliruptor alkaliphilus]
MVAGAAATAYATMVEPRWYRIDHHVLPGALRRPGRLRILHVADTHLAPWQDHRVRFLASLADLDHDLVVATGDLLGWVDHEEATARALAPLTSGGRPGLLVLGSNDRYGPVPKSPLAYFTAPGRRIHGQPLDTQRFVGAMERHGYRTLVDTTTEIPTTVGTVAVGGIDDPHLAFGQGRAPDEVLPPADQVAPTDPDAALRLGLVHAPYRAALDRLVQAGHDVLLAGHTHGGQVRVPGVGALTANCDVPLRQARGVSRWDRRWLHVSPGLGHSAYAPLRFACRPEATLLDLTG